MPKAVESQVLVHSGRQAPTLQFEGCPCTVCKSRKNEIIGITPFSEILFGLRGNVEIFLPARFLLFEYDPGVLAEFLHFTPCEFLNVAFTNPRKA